MKLVKNASQEDEQPTIQELTGYRARLVARLADSLIRDLESEENEIARIVAGKILDEVLLAGRCRQNLRGLLEGSERF
jgi:hypothetical protein